MDVVFVTDTSTDYDNDEGNTCIIEIIIGVHKVQTVLIYVAIHYCKNESVYCTLNCPNTHTKIKTVCVLGQNAWCAVKTFIFTV